MADLTPERLAELRRIAAETTPGTREGTRMPDAPKRCPFCNSGDRREETWRDRPAYSFSCGTVFYANGEVALRYFSCYAREKERKERAIREQLAVARAEAERWRKKYEALKAGIEELIRHVRLVLPERGR